jgi:ferredoxin-NADP reductase
VVEITDATGTIITLGHVPPRMREFEGTAVVDARREAAAGVVELILRREDGSAWPSWTAGSHIDVLLPGGLTRQYSLCGIEGDRARWRIGVLHEPEGRGGSDYLYNSVELGSKFRVRGPRNVFALDDYEEYVFIAGGIGITPILAMIREAQRVGKRWTLHYGGKSRASMAFLDEVTANSASALGQVKIYARDESDRMSLDEILATSPPGVGVYACGPASLVLAVESFAPRWPQDAIHTERFSVDQADLVHEDDETIEVELEASGISVTVGAHESILAAVEREGIGVLSSCRVGTCGTCETPVLEGEPDHRDFVLDNEDKARNDCMMICVSRALSHRLVLDL